MHPTLTTHGPGDAHAALRDRLRHHDADDHLTALLCLTSLAESYGADEEAEWLTDHHLNTRTN